MGGFAMNFSYFDRAAAAFPDVCFERPPDVSVLLGSGWGDALECDRTLARVAYSDVPGFGATTVRGHAGEFLLLERDGRRIAAWCGRRHYYEGDGWECVVLPVEMIRRMGGSLMLLTNAAGGINGALRPGDFVVLRDHLNTVGQNPLIGPHREEWGERFPDMSAVYSRHHAELLHAAAKRAGVRVSDGVYAYTSGPVYETPAEIRSYRSQGADVVGMSTVPEAIFARACSMSVAGLSLVSNLAAGISARTLNHAEVMAAGEAAKPLMRAIVNGFIDLL